MGNLARTVGLQPHANHYSVCKHADGYIVQWQWHDSVCSGTVGLQVEFTNADRQHMFNLVSFLESVGYTHQPGGNTYWKE